MNHLRIANHQKAIKIKDRVYLKYFKKKNKKKLKLLRMTRQMLMKRSTNFQKKMSKVMKL
jgi:hypothetical protein